MILVLPGPLFSLAAVCVGIPMSDHMSPGQFDISVGRRTDATRQMDELVSAGQKYGNSMAVTESVVRMIKDMENSPPGALLGNNDRKNQNEQNVLKLLGIVGKSQTHVEFRFWMFRLFTLVSFIALFCFFFIHGE